MAIVKKRNDEIANSLILESNEAVDLPPAEIDETVVTVEFERSREFVPEIVEELEIGAIAETIPVIKDGSTFAIHGETKTFWVKIWHREDTEMTEIERVHILNCIPVMRGVRVVLPDQEPDE